MKKKLSFAMALMFILSMFSVVSASAATPDAYYNDVRTFINNYPVESYTINNHSVVSTDDIKDYGFRVVWDQNARAVYISKDAAKNAWNPTKRSTSVVNYKAYAGDVAFKTVPSNIKVYVNSQKVESYVGAGLTWINLSDLTKASCSHSNITKQWFADERQSFLWISSEQMAPKTAIPYAFLTAPKAYELAVKAVNNSIYAGKAVVIPKVFEYGFTDANYVKADGGYDFDLCFGSTVVAASVTVNIDGSSYFNNIPAWLTYICE